MRAAGVAVRPASPWWWIWIPGLAGSLGGAWDGVPRAAVEAGGCHGLKIQRGEGLAEHARSQVAGLVGGQAGAGGEAAEGVAYVGGE